MAEPRRRRLPPLNAIRAFEAAARYRNFTRAAEELSVTQAAVSYQVKLLEERLGVRLFHRHAGGLTLTPEAEAYFCALRPALDAIAEATERVSGAANGRPLTVSTYVTFAMRWLIPRLPEFEREHPGVELRLLTASTAAEQFLMDVDAVISGPARQPGWSSRRFLGEARVPVLSPELMRRKPLRRPADLRRHTLLHAATLRDAWPRWLALAGHADLVETQVLNRYRAGIVSYTDVVTAQVTALNARRALVQLMASRQTSAVALIQSLGGGWSTDMLTAEPVKTSATR